MHPITKLLVLAFSAWIVLFGFALKAEAAECLPIPQGFEDSYKVVTLLADQTHVVWYSDKYSRIVITIGNCVVYVVENIQTAELNKAYRFYRDTR